MNFRYLAVAGLLFAAAVPAAAQLEESCAYNQVTGEVSAVMSPGGQATLQVAEGQILFGAEPQPCGAATTTNTDTIKIAGQAGSGERLVLDERSGLFGPGVEEDTGLFREIEIFATLGDGSDSVVLYLTEGDDDVAPGVNGIGLTPDGDVDVVFTDADENPVAATFPLEIHALGGNDYVNGRGEFGAGLAYLGPLVIHGGAGEDELLRGSFDADVINGGPGNDVLDGQDGDDIMDGGAGDDALTAGGGNDQLIGGPGADSLIASTGDDVVFAIDLEADTPINGGPGMDTAYYDAGLDASPLFVENPIGEDESPPEVVCASADGIWHADDVGLPCTGADPESQIPNAGDEAFELSTNVPVGSETADAATGTREVCNGAGLCSTAGPVTGNRVDKKAPVNPTGVESTGHTPGKWSRDREVSIVFDAASDGGSGVDGISYSWTTVATSDADQSKDLEETATALTSSTLGNGRWYLHLATADNVGNWSSPDHYGPYHIDGARPSVRVLPASVRVGRSIRLRYRTADNNARTRERITLARGGSIVAAWTRPMAVAQWSAIQSLPWTPRRSGPYSYCVQAWDPAGNTRRDCTSLR